MTESQRITNGLYYLYGKDFYDYKFLLRDIPEHLWPNDFWDIFEMDLSEPGFKTVRIRPKYWLEF